MYGIVMLAFGTTCMHDTIIIKHFFECKYYWVNLLAIVAFWAMMVFYHFLNVFRSKTKPSLSVSNLSL